MAVSTTIPLDALTETIARAISRFPAERSRIERAAQLIATGHVDHLIADLWMVRSQTDDTTYLVDETGCPCVDAVRHPEMNCKHEWATRILIIAAERAQRLAPASTDEELGLASDAEIDLYLIGRTGAWKAAA
jgi:hypothetical protein